MASGLGISCTIQTGNLTHPNSLLQGTGLGRGPKASTSQALGAGAYPALGHVRLPPPLSPFPSFIPKVLPTISPLETQALNSYLPFNPHLPVLLLIFWLFFLILT